LGQNATYSERANNFRSAAVNGHHQYLAAGEKLFPYIDVVIPATEPKPTGWQLREKPAGVIPGRLFLIIMCIAEDIADRLNENDRRKEQEDGQLDQLAFVAVAAFRTEALPAE
jgi:hypothetical protein